jgi:DNA-binding CsgD family transcriptional regulator
MALDVEHLPAAAEQLEDLSPAERKILALLGEGLASREIAERLTMSEATVYRAIADLLDAIELDAPTTTAGDIHAAGGTRPATTDEVARFHEQFGPFQRDTEGWVDRMQAGPERARVRFDQNALAEDLARLSDAGRTAISAARREFESDGVPLDRLRACDDDHPSGTRLPGCMKVYVPDWAGRWRIVIQIAMDADGPLLTYLASGVGHQPRGARAPNAYQIAHHRLHRRWPRRTLS